MPVLLSSHCLVLGALLGDAGSLSVTFDGSRIDKQWPPYKEAYTDVFNTVKGFFITKL